MVPTSGQTRRPAVVPRRDSNYVRTHACPVPRAACFYHGRDLTPPQLGRSLVMAATTGPPRPRERVTAEEWVRRASTLVVAGVAAYASFPASARLRPGRRNSLPTN